ncbi:MAG: ferrous iron transport protein A [Saprospiraceae bacterium]|nr:ferrous iron transport protein A [Saprospiraceae bacterium]
MCAKLSQLEVGRPAFLGKFSVSPLHRKLLSMGFLPGQAVSVLRRLPLNGSLYVKVDSRHMALRHNEADQILVKL